MSSGPVTTSKMNCTKKAIPAKLKRQKRLAAAAIGIFLFVSAFTSTLSYTIAEVVANNRIQTVKQTLKSTQNITIDLFNKSKIIYVDHEERLSVIEQVLQIYEYSYQSTQKAQKLINVLISRFMGIIRTGVSPFFGRSSPGGL